MIDETGNARLADFGLLTIISDPANFFSSSSYTQGGIARWMSPELISPDRFGFTNDRPTKSSDCYALGMVIYETISGHLPFHGHTELFVAVKIVEGERPPREPGFSNRLWEMLERCWMSQPNARPSIEDVLQCLESVSQSLELPPPGVDVGMEHDSDWDLGSDSPGMFSSLIPPQRFVVSAFPILLRWFSLTRTHQYILGLCIPPARQTSQIR